MIKCESTGVVKLDSPVCNQLLSKNLENESTVQGTTESSFGRSKKFWLHEIQSTPPRLHSLLETDLAHHTGSTTLLDCILTKTVLGTVLVAAVAKENGFALAYVGHVQGGSDGFKVPGGKNVLASTG